MSGTSITTEEDAMSLTNNPDVSNYLAAFQKQLDEMKAQLKRQDDETKEQMKEIKQEIWTAKKYAVTGGMLSAAAAGGTSYAGTIYGYPALTVGFYVTGTVVATIVLVAGVYYLVECGGLQRLSSFCKDLYALVVRTFESGISHFSVRPHVE